VYDISSKESFEKSKEWLQELRKLGKPDVVILLVGNKLGMGICMYIVHTAVLTWAY
jgi:hypothetical protein